MGVEVNFISIFSDTVAKAIPVTTVFMPAGQRTKLSHIPKIKTMVFG
jgi:hypothetical protein